MAEKWDVKWLGTEDRQNLTDAVDHHQAGVVAVTDPGHAPGPEDVAMAEEENQEVVQRVDPTVAAEAGATAEVAAEIIKDAADLDPSLAPGVQLGPMGLRKAMLKRMETELVVCKESFGCCVVLRWQQTLSNWLTWQEISWQVIIVICWSVFHDGLLLFVRFADLILEFVSPFFVTC